MTAGKRCSSVALATMMTVAMHSAYAQAPQCSEPAFTQSAGPLGTARMVGAPRTTLQPVPDGCTDAACRRSPYVIPGNVVLTGPKTDGFVCVVFPGVSRVSIGWVPADRVHALPSSPPQLSAWQGTWREFDDSISLKVQGQGLVAKGDAYYPSANPPTSERPYGPNLGEMNGSATPDGDRLTIIDPSLPATDPSSCRVELRLVPPYLIASDNMMCGGNNVTFTGIYRRG